MKAVEPGSPDPRPFLSFRYMESVKIHYFLA